MTQESQNVECAGIEQTGLATATPAEAVDGCVLVLVPRLLSRGLRASLFFFFYSLSN
jgi:hypothetical protein